MSIFCQPLVEARRARNTEKIIIIIKNDQIKDDMQWILKKKKKILLKRAIFCFEIVKKKMWINITLYVWLQDKTFISLKEEKNI